MNVKYQIFVSSTYEDLKEERNEVIKACLNMGHIPVGMEMFNAADEEQWAVITRTIDQRDYHVVIIAHRYGSTVDGISFTEKEYDYAISQGVPVLGFVIDESASWPSNRVDKDQLAVEALKRFRSKVKEKMVRYWRDKAELQAHFAMSLTTTINVNPRRGWIRAPRESSSEIAQTISDLTRENAQLREMVQEKEASGSSVGDIVDIICAANLGKEVRHINGSEFVEDLIRMGRSYEDSGFVQTTIPDGYDPNKVKDFINDLLILGVLTGAQAGAAPKDVFTVHTTDISGQIHAKLLKRKRPQSINPA